MTRADQLLLAYAITDFIACIIPGPAVLSIMSIGLSGSRRSMFAAIGGINFSNVIWYSMVGAGLIALVRAAPEVFVALRWAGIAYLFWLGMQTWRAHMHLSVSRSREPIGIRRGFASGVAIQLSNPKALVFFTVFLPPFIDMHRAVGPQVVTLAAIGISLEILVLSSYGLLAYKLGKLVVSERSEKWIAHISGGILMAVAAAMALSQTT